MRQDKIDHLLRAAADVSGQRRFVVVGAAALLLRVHRYPAILMMTTELDLFAADADDVDAASDLIDGSLGQASQFHQTYGYYADGVSATTAILPLDWETRAIEYSSPMTAGVVAIVPDPNDLALAKLCAWREKDIQWLRAGVKARIFSFNAMAARVTSMPPRAPDESTLRDRLSRLKTA
jgi:hypothetical protein